MGKPSSSRFLLMQILFFSSKPSVGGCSTGSAISRIIKRTHNARSPSLCSWFFNSQRACFSSSMNMQVVTKRFDPLANISQPRNITGLRHFSLKNRMSSENFAEKLLGKPVLATKNALMRYKEAVRLQLEAFWRRNYLAILGAGGFFVCILLWRVLFGIATLFVGLSEGMAKYGFLALSSAVVAFTGLWLRSRYTVSPDKVYRMAMRRLNTSAGILEVMGAPLTGTDLRAYVMSGGGISLRNFYPKLRSKRCFLIFPVEGPERKGLVSVEVKKKKGQYDMKLLAVDVPMGKGPDQRLFLIGDEEEYKVGDGLISDLRDPVIKALAAAREFEARDDKEDEDEDAREIEEAERKQQEEEKRLDNRKP